MSASRDVEVGKGRGVVSWTATLGLVVHAAADGVALGALPQQTKLMLRLVLSSVILSQSSSGYCLLGDNVAQSSGQFWFSDVPAPRRP